MDFDCPVQLTPAHPNAQCGDCQHDLNGWYILKIETSPIPHSEEKLVRLDLYLITQPTIITPKFDLSLNPVITLPSNLDHSSEPSPSPIFLSPSSNISEAPKHSPQLQINPEPNSNNHQSRKVRYHMGSPTASPVTKKSKKKSKPKPNHLNIRGMFLHIFGDALASVAAIISGLVIWIWDEFEYRYYIDPIVSLVIVVIILYHAIPLIKSASVILLQTVPIGTDIKTIREQLVALPEITEIHDLHIWQLEDSKIISSIHIKCPDQKAYESSIPEMKRIFHEHDIHSVTVQPEFVLGEVDNKCQHNCPDNTCSRKICCNHQL